MAKKINLAILFGGRSAEHDISLRSAKNIIKSVDQTKYNLIFIGIDKKGNWLQFDNQQKFAEIIAKDELNLEHSKGHLALQLKEKGVFSSLNGQNNLSIDVAFPVLHGPFGEDGSVQGLLQLADIPFVGASLLGSAVGMDKDVMKRLLRDAGLPISDYICLRAGEEIPDFGYFDEKLGMPCFVKPANMGSSVGINKAENEKELRKAIEFAFQFDKKVIIEKFIEGREIECAVIGNAAAKVSVTGEIVALHDFYSFDAKYIDDQGAETRIPADISPEKENEIRAIALQVYATLECEGLGRVDVFLQENGDVIVNELNTIPGFTSISMYPMLWKESGIEYAELIDQLVGFAFE